MLGVILCGGKSSRMGADKGLLKLETNTWAQSAFDKMMELNLPIVLSVNENQYSDYSSVFPSTELVKDDERLKIGGPLCGVLSVHLRHTAEDLFVLACDMPLMQASVLRELFDIYQQNPDSEACLFRDDGGPEPLCAIYKSSGLSKVIKLHDAAQLSKHSMKFMLEHLSTFSTPLREEQKNFFRNFNAHAELNGL